MIWKNLKENKCPKCNRDFVSYNSGAVYTLVPKYRPKTLINQDLSILSIDELPKEKAISHPCGFKIRDSRYAQIVSSQITQDLEDKLNKEFEETTT